MYQHIYEKLEIGQPAIYQIKFKGNLSSSLSTFAKRFKVTPETANKRFPVTMLTGELSGQTELLEVLINLNQRGHSIISVACTEVLSCKDHYAQT